MPGPDARPRRLVAVSHTGLVSGAETVLLRAMEMASDDGWDVRALTPSGAFEERAKALGIGVELVPDLKLPALPMALAAPLQGLRSLRAGWKLRRAARDADVVLLNGILGLPALWAAHTRTPSAWLVHDVIHRPLWRRLLRAVGPSADLAIAVSDAVAVPLRASGLQVTVVRNGTRWPVAPAHPDLGSAPVVGAAALLTPWKGQLVLLDAIAALDDRSVRVELLGGRFPKDAPYVESLEARAAQPDLAGRVSMLGFDPDPLERMRSWTVAALPSVDPEAGPLALLEYLSLGLPVVASDHGGTPEVIGDAGILVPPRDVAATAAAIDRLLRDPEARRACGAAGRRQVADGLTLEHQRVQLLRVLDDLAAGRQSASSSP